METLTARVVGFAAGSPVTYTTDVSLGTTDDSVTYTLALRYSTFLAAYSKLVEHDATFVFDFPKKGGFWSSPTPEERQPQLDAFVVAALAHVAKREFAPELCAVLEELLDVAAHAVTVEAAKEGDAEEEKEDGASSETSESSVEEPVAEPIAPLLVADKSEEKVTEVPEAKKADAPEPTPVAVEEGVAVAAEAPKEEEVAVVAEEVKTEEVAVEVVHTEKVTVETAETVVHTETTTVVVEEIDVVEATKEEVAVVEETVVVQEETVAVVADETVTVVEETVVTSSPSSSPKKKKKSKAKAKAAEAAAAAADPFAVTSTVTTTSLAGGEVQHITFANGMQLKKKTLSEDQKRLRNMRRKEKRKKSSLKIRGGKSLAGKADTTSSTDDSE